MQLNEKNLFLSACCSILKLTPNKYANILTKYPSLEIALRDNFRKLKPKPTWIQTPDTKTITQIMTQRKIELTKNNIEIVTIENKEYPQTLKILNNHPLILYVQGNKQTLNHSNFLTVVGSRKPTHIGKTIIQTILNPVCTLGIGTISGLALGIDSMAHECALVNKSNTIAIVGSGLDDTSFYPKENIGLKNKIIGSGDGVVVSEYPPGVPASPFQFPMRNRLLAAFSELTWVVQAGIKSGTLITARYAQDLGKTICTTPSSIFDQEFGGNTYLLKQGANIITEYEDILQLLGLSIHRRVQPLPTVNFESEAEEKIYSTLNIFGVGYDEIVFKSQLSQNTVSSSLTMLELKGLITHLGENIWAKSR